MKEDLVNNTKIAMDTKLQELIELKRKRDTLIQSSAVQAQKNSQLVTKSAWSRWGDALSEKFTKLKPDAISPSYRQQIANARQLQTVKS